MRQQQTGSTLAFEHILCVEELSLPFKNEMIKITMWLKEINFVNWPKRYIHQYFHKLDSKFLQ